MSERRAFGIYAAMTTLFADGLAIDQEGLGRHALACLQAGCAGISVFGTTGEGPSIGFAERRAVLDTLKRHAIPGDRIVPGITVSAVDDALANAALAHEFGCRALLVTPPNYYKGVEQAAVIEWYATLVRGLPAGGPRLILYNIPQVTGVPVSREAVAELKARFPGKIIGVKDSSGDWDNTEGLLGAFPDLAILIGDERLLERGVRLGAAGSISGVANFRPDLLNAVMAGAEADPALSPLVNAIVKFPSTPAVKALVGHVTGNKAWRAVRPPLQALSDADATALGRTYDDLLARLVA